MAIDIHPHARQRLLERGVTSEEVTAAIEEGERFEAKYDRIGFRRNFEFNGMWRSRHYSTKQVEVYAVREGMNWIVVTVIAKYF